jgi:hypothetical protein
VAWKYVLSVSHYFHFSSLRASDGLRRQSLAAIRTFALPAQYHQLSRCAPHFFAIMRLFKCRLHTSFTATPANLLTVSVSMFACIMSCVVGYLADRHGQRCLISTHAFPLCSRTLLLCDKRPLLVDWRRGVSHAHCVDERGALLRGCLFGDMRHIPADSQHDVCGLFPALRRYVDHTKYMGVQQHRWPYKRGVFL